jgi:HAD superfamily hydrolase (TIGR01509 family)
VNHAVGHAAVASEDRRLSATVPQAVIFDMDGIIIDSEPNWDRARLAVVAAFGGTYHADVPSDVMGMSPPEWSTYLRDRIRIPLSAEQIEREVVARLAADYERDRPFFPGAIDAVRAIGARWPTAIASSSGRALIDLVVSLAGLSETFTATVSGAEVAHGKPAPDVYLKAASLLGADPRRCVAIEDSSNGIRAGKNAGMRVIAIPTQAYPPAADALALADIVLPAITALTPATIDEMFASAATRGASKATPS